MSNSVPRARNTDATATGEQYNTRERVHDIEDTGGVLVVIETVERRADRFELTDGVTVAQIHHDYPASDRVVVCAYERHLDRVTDNWRSHSKTHLRQRFGAEFDQVPPGALALPSSRVERYVAGNYTRLENAVYCENCETPTRDTTAWLEHFARDCPGVDR